MLMDDPEPQDLDGTLKKLQMRYERAEWDEWEDEDDNEYKGEDYEEVEVEESKESTSLESSQESVPDFGVVQVEKRKQSILRRKAEKKSDAFRKLIAASINYPGCGMKNETASIETIITPDDEESDIQTSGSSSTSKNYSFPDTEISDSQLKLLNLFNVYPIPDDPGNVRAFWALYNPVPTYTNDGIKRFADTMKALNIRPISCMNDLLRSDAINLRYYGLDPRAVKAICESIYNNTSVQSLDLKDNWLTLDACEHLKNLLLETEILESMNLSGCKIGSEGVKNLLPGITENWSLVELDLSNCALGDEGMNILAPVIKDNQLLQTLNLADNQLGSECAQALQAMLTHNTKLLHLNLSWNGFFTKEASIALFKGLVENKTLLSINLSWNAFNKETLPSLSTFLQQNQTLQILNLSGNRFDEQAGTIIAKSLAKNIGLQKLYLGDNPVKQTGGSALIHVLIPEQSPESTLQYVNLENLWVNKDVLPDLEKIERERPWLRVELGGIFSNYKVVGPDEGMIYFKRALYEGIKPKKKKQRREFGHFILSLEDKLNTRGEFTYFDLSDRIFLYC
ncbi:leucine-rich repeat-containing protein 74A-like [Athalia rosae]|uniref:leucine-rich repeat-containing protein 74A-like n=1 Tax=Athalia rosae TaxID=37344 RepID=UPI0020349711|nr:leucine-rich repeat-containing protein 74A-like [Athalia rosae]